MATAANLPPGEDIIEPLALLAAPILVPVGVNLAYTSGWVVELLWRRMSRDTTRRVGRLLMQVGIGFSAFVILTPSVCWSVIWAWHLITNHKVDIS